MTDTFVAETIIILVALLLIGLILGIQVGRIMAHRKLMADSCGEEPVCIDGFYVYLISGPRFNELRICEMRCERMDRKHRAINELTGTEG